MTRPVPDPQSSDESSSRRARLAARRRRHVRIATALAIVLLIGAGVTVAVYALDQSGEAAKAFTTVPPGPSFGGLSLPPLGSEKVSQLRALDHEHPLKLWVGGDSLAGSFGPALGDAVGATGVVQTRIDYKVSSGLWSNDIRDWPDEVKVEMATQNPEAVVYIIGANDTSVVNKVDANGDGTPDWENLYRAKVNLMMQEFVGTEHRTVFWLGTPTLGPSNMDNAAVELNRVVKDEAARHAPDVIFVDTYKLFSGPDGTYSRRIYDENGNQITARIGDGVHFSMDGAAYLARAVAALVESRFRVESQADIAHPIAWTLASGSGEAVPGYSSQPRPRYRTYNGNGSTQTTYSSGNGGSTETTIDSGPVTTAGPPPTSPPTTSAPPPPPPTTVGSPPTTGG